MEPTQVVTRTRARPGTKQAQKSDETRRLLLEAAIECLTEDGFSNTTMTSISRRAGISRGAMQYHFETVGDVHLALISYIQERRLSDLANLPSTLREGHEPNRFARRIDLLAAFFDSPVSVAFFELSVASRASENLASALKAAHISFGKEWMRIAVDVFPEWRGRERELEMACTLTQTLLEGLAWRKLTHHPDDEMPRLLRTYIADRVADIFEFGDRNLTPQH